MINLDELTPAGTIKVVRLIHREQTEAGYIEIYQANQEIYKKIVSILDIAGHTEEIVQWLEIGHWVESESLSAATDIVTSKIIVALDRNSESPCSPKMTENEELYKLAISAIEALINDMSVDWYQTESNKEALIDDINDLFAAR